MPKIRLPSKTPTPAMTVFDAGLSNEKLVYIMVASKMLPYRRKRSAIAYIGSSEKGIARMATSAAVRAKAILELPRVNKFDVIPISSPGRPGAKRWWKKLERAFLLAFWEEYGSVPQLNTQGKRLQRKDEFDVFSEEIIKGHLRNLEKSGRR